MLRPTRADLSKPSLEAEAGRVRHDPHQRRRPGAQREESLAALARRARGGLRATVHAGRPSSSSSTTAAATAPGRCSTELAGTDPSVGAIRFRRNFGKAAALMAGFQAARGDVVFTHRRRPPGRPRRDPPLPRRAREQGYDVVSGWKKTRHDPWHKVYPSRVFNWMVSALTGCHLHDHNCGFKLYRRPCSTRSASTASCTGSSPCWRTPAASASARSWSAPAAAAFGQSKYGVIAHAQGVPRPADRPLPDALQPAPAPRPGRHRPGHCWRSAAWSCSPWPSLWLDPANRPIGNRPLLFYAGALVSIGIQLLSLGILAELVTAYNIRPEDTYSVVETIPTREDAPAAVRARPHRDQP